MVADTAAFCGHCRAPQISVPNASTASADAFVAQSSPQAPPPVELPAAAAPPQFAAAPSAKLPLRWSAVLPTAAATGFITFLILILLGSPIFFFLLVPVGAAIAVVLTSRIQQRHFGAQARLTTGQGAVLGCITSLASFVFYGIVLSASLIFGRDQLMKELSEQIAKNMASNTDPQVAQMLKQLNTPDGFLFFLAIGVVLLFVLFTVMGSVSGAVTASVIRKPR